MDEKNILISLYQNTQTALQSISELLKKTNNKQFKNLLNAQFSRYKDFCEKLEDYSEKNNITLKDNSWFEKAKLWSSIQMGTLTDNSTRHLAELMLVGTVMGTLTCYKTKSDHKNANKECLSLISSLEEMEEQNFNELKKYLKV